MGFEEAALLFLLGVSIGLWLSLRQLIGLMKDTLAKRKRTR
jgi:hypothetical protein